MLIIYGVRTRARGKLIKNSCKILFLCLSVSLCFGCKKPKDIVSVVSNDYLKTVLVPKPVDFSDVNIIEDLEFIVLETSDKSLFGTVSRMRVYSDRIFLLDPIYAQELFVYTMDGKHISTIGANRGQGPQDFVKLSNFEIDYVNELLLVMDNWGQKFMMYDFDGNFIRRIDSKFHVTEAVLLPDDHIVHAKQSDEHKLPGQSNNKIIITDFNQNIIKEGFAFDDNKNINMTNNGIIRSLPNGEIIFAPRLRDTIYNVTIDSITPKYAIDYGVNKRISKQTIEGFKEDRENPINVDKALIRIINEGYMCFFGRNVESVDHLYLSLGFNSYTIAVFYNKNTGASIALSNDGEREKRIESGLYRLLCSDEEGYFYGSLNTTQIDRLIPLFPKLKEIDDLEDMNPIIFRYKIKNVE